ncbi:BTAD domain-containing putative transcriptional regulator [Nakamurella sp.]|uniref:BTAD domain-containing putative transcriptional regulator n=1 Tax=Nakamurella sp. TaxID=1869182 RepID=UPI003784047F
MEIRDLGPLMVELDGLPTAIGNGRLAAVLSPLANRVGEVLTPAILIDAVWGPQPPPKAGQLLESVIWRLRKELEPGRAARAEPVVLRREPLGYRLDLPASAVDSAHLRTVVPQLREWAAAGRFDRVLDRSAAVLALWRGEPYAEVPDTGWLTPARHRLSTARLDVAELRVQALLDLGRPEEAIGDVDPLIADHPLRERLWALRITGLYRAGRQSDALTAFQRIRGLLADELGVDPGTELRELHHRVLGHDPDLDRRRPVAVTAGTLPRRRASLIGRDADVARLTGALAGTPLITLVGPGGVGKTRLAVEVGHAAHASFPDGAWFVDLAPIGADLLGGTLAGAFELTGPPGRNPVAAVTDFLSDRTTLIVLDNCEHLVAAAAEVVDEIVARCPGVRVLATSREPLDAAGELIHPVGPLPIDGTGAAPGPAEQLFVERVGSAADLDPSGSDGELIGRICRAVGGLPLGIELAAAQVRTFELAEIVRSLERNPAELARPGTGPRRQASLWETVDWGYRLARADEQALHRRLAVIPGQFTLDLAAALCERPPLHPDAALSLVGGLVHRSLLTSSRPSRPGGPTTFHQLVPIRAHAADLLDSGERAAVEIARDRWFSARLAGAPIDGRPGHTAVLHWLDDDSAALHATLESMLVRNPDRAAFGLVNGLFLYWYDRGRLAEAQHWAALLRASTDRLVADPTDRALADAAAGSVLAMRHRGDEAAPLLRGSRPILAAAPADRRDDVAAALLVAAAAAWTGDIWDVAADFVDTALALGRSAELPHLTMAARGIRSANWSLTGDRSAGIAEARQVLRDNEALGNDIAALFALVTLTVTTLMGGDPVGALGYSDELLLTHRRLGALAVSDTIETRASIRAAAGDAAEAIRCLGASAALNRRLGRDWPWHEFTPAVLDDLRNRVPPDDFMTYWASGERLGLGDPARFTPEWI